ncbi:uncharacterized protein LOC116247861 isoform X9 [Nymphaea colorata]|uniref:uncharacterized protein LOC116247861 isoform X9 n=1 Tax=Nymphaea colorata TaxID=210225 RepID=UPI00214E0921|nr:uncharacterized protein LOC116247861 isoform X9 [Nymphaea colorata]
MSVEMGKNQAYKAMQRARMSSTSGAPENIEDGMMDGSFHSPEWHAARLASLNTSHTITWEEFKKKQRATRNPLRSSANRSRSHDFVDPVLMIMWNLLEGLTRSRVRLERRPPPSTSLTDFRRLLRRESDFSGCPPPFILWRLTVSIESVTA